MKWLIIMNHLYVKFKIIYYKNLVVNNLINQKILKKVKK